MWTAVAALQGVGCAGEVDSSTEPLAVGYRALAVQSDGEEGTSIACPAAGWRASTGGQCHCS